MTRDAWVKMGFMGRLPSKAACRQVQRKAALCLAQTKTNTGTPAATAVFAVLGTSVFGSLQQDAAVGFKPDVLNAVLINYFMNGSRRLKEQFPLK